MIYKNKNREKTRPESASPLGFKGRKLPSAVPPLLTQENLHPLFYAFHAPLRDANPINATASLSY